MYDVIQSSTKTAETEDVYAEEEMQNAENDNSVIQVKWQKRLGKRKQEEILCTRRYKIHAEPEKILPFKAAAVLPMES